MAIDQVASTLSCSEQIASSTHDVLGHIAKLKLTLNTFPRATPKECWDCVQAIECFLSHDVMYSQNERVLCQRLKSAVSDMIAAHWEGVQVPSGLPMLPLAALDGSIRRRLEAKRH